MPETVNRHAPAGPGPKGSPDQPIVRRWSQGAYNFAELKCGHTIRMTKTYRWEEGVRVPCGQCPRTRRKP